MELNTGDIVLFSGSCIVANTIKVLTLCNWSHVGMIVIDSHYNEPLLYESTHDDSLTGLDLGESNQGVQLVRLSERVDHYDGEVSVRKLIGANLTEDDLYRFHLMRKSFVGRKFEESELQITMSAISFIETDEDLTTLFCSELVAQSYIELGLLPGNIASNNYTQEDFTENIVLSRGMLGKEIQIK